MIKSFIAITTIAIMMACNQQQKSYDYGEQRAMDFVSDMITKQGFEVKSIDVVRCDTLITDKYLEDSELEIKTGSIRVSGGSMSPKEYKDFLTGIIEHAHNINLAWFENSLGKNKTNDSLQAEGKYVFMPVYTVKAETSSKMNPTISIRILSDFHGQPQCTDEEFLKKVDDFREKVEVVYTAMF